MIFMAQAKIDYTGLLLSKVFKAFYNAAHFSVPRPSLASPYSTGITGHALHTSQPLSMLFPLLSIPLPPTLPCQVPLLLLQGWLRSPCSVKPVSLLHEELITPTVFPLPRGRPP